MQLSGTLLATDERTFGALVSVHGSRMVNVRLTPNNIERSCCPLQRCDSFICFNYVSGFRYNIILVIVGFCPFIGFFFILKI